MSNYLQELVTYKQHLPFLFRLQWEKTEPQPSTSTDYFEPKEASEEASAIVTDTEPIVSQPVIMHLLFEREVYRKNSVSSSLY